MRRSSTLPRPTSTIGAAPSLRERAGSSAREPSDATDDDTTESAASPASPPARDIKARIDALTAW
jgi:hypothetical protein